MVVTRSSNLISQMRRGAIQYCVMALMDKQERYGFELARRLAEVDGLATSEGTLYPLLSRLRQEGLVETTWRESPQGPPRRYYTLTSDGRQSLESFVQHWIRFRDGVDHLLIGGHE
jgi:PadR family transcriptional regulator PadR